MEKQPAGGRKSRKPMIISIIVLLLIFIAVGVLVKAKPRKIGTADLKWNANAEANLAGYKIYYGPSPRTGDCPPDGYPEKIDVGKTDTPANPRYIIKDLEEGKTYYFSVTSYNDKNIESCFSAEVSKTIQSVSPSKNLWQKIKGWF